jgi:hypothetical protein
MNQARWLFANPSLKVNPDADSSYMYFFNDCIYFNLTYPNLFGIKGFVVVVTGDCIYFLLFDIAYCHKLLWNSVFHDK